jgi:hypothetical protein
MYGLDEGTTIFQTVKLRVFAINPSGISHQKVPPLQDVEDIIVE